jgi:hypothetical protein
MAGKRYTVLSEIDKDGETYEPGEVIELTAKQAEEMPWAVELIPDVKPEKDSGK